MVHLLECCVLLVSSYLSLFYFIPFLKINYSIEKGVLCFIVFRDCIITVTLFVYASFRQKNKILAVTKMFYLIGKVLAQWSNCIKSTTSITLVFTISRYYRLEVKSAIELYIAFTINLIRRDHIQLIEWWMQYECSTKVFALY